MYNRDDGTNAEVSFSALFGGHGRRSFSRSWIVSSSVAKGELGRTVLFVSSYSSYPGYPGETETKQSREVQSMNQGNMLL
jgi:hypothetical protein